MGGGKRGLFRGTKQRKLRPRDHIRQNEQTRSIANKLKLTKKEQEQLHRLAGEWNYGYSELLEIATQWFNKEKEKK